MAETINNGQRNIFTEFDQLRSQYLWGSIRIISNLSYSQYNIIEKIEYYTNSRYLSGDFDGRFTGVAGATYRNNNDGGRKKPFYNIINNAVNVATRATDFDTKDIKILPNSPKFRIQSWLLEKELDLWMQESNFAKTLNDMGETRARYGGVVVKKVMEDGELSIQIPQWKNLLTDQIDIDNGVIAERHYMSQVDLTKKRGSWEGLDENWTEIMDLFKSKSEKARSYSNNNTSSSGDFFDQSGEYSEDRVEVIEIEGEFPNSFLTGDDDDETEYSLQKYFIIDQGNDDEEGNFILFKEKVKDSQYKFLAWKELAGRALGMGVVEEGFEAQRWTNDSKIKERDVMELSSKLIYKSTDDRVYDNLLTDLDNGAVINLEAGKDIVPLTTVSNALPEFDQNIASWENQFMKATSTFPAITGEKLPSNTPLGSVEIQNQEARSIFEYRQEQAGIFIEGIIEEWVLPQLTKGITSEHVLNAQFSSEDLVMIDAAFSTWSANKAVVTAILDGGIVTEDDYNEAIESANLKVRELGDRRFLDVPKDFYKDIDAKVKIVTTNEQFNKQTQLQSMDQLLARLQDPTLLQDPVRSAVVERMVEISGIGISPSQIRSAAARVPQAQPEAPQEGAPQAPQPEAAPITQ